MPKRNPLNSGKPVAFGLARWYGNPDRIQRGRWKRATTHSASRTQAAGYVFYDVNTAGERCELTLLLLKEYALFAATSISLEAIDRKLAAKSVKVKERGEKPLEGITKKKKVLSKGRQERTGSGFIGKNSRTSSIVPGAAQTGISVLIIKTGTGRTTRSQILRNSVSPVTKRNITPERIYLPLKKWAGKGRSLCALFLRKFFEIVTEGSKNFLRYSLTRREIFGQSIVYGMGPNKLFVDLNAAGFPISFEDCKNLYNAYCDEFNLAVGFLRSTGKLASQQGFVVNLNKRRRNWLLPDQNNRDVFPLGWKDPKYRGVIASIQREGGNAVIQSVNADITKYAMTTIRRYIKKNKVRSNLMLQVYDEIVTCTHKDDSPEFVEVKRKLMLDAAYRWITSVPIEVEGEVLPYWTK